MRHFQSMFPRIFVRLLNLRIFLLIGCLQLQFSLFGSTETSQNPQFIIVDSYLIGFFSGLCVYKEQRLKNAFHLAGRKAKNDAKIWAGLFVSDSNSTGIRRTGEVFSRFTYQLPQTVGGLATAQYYNTLTRKVNFVEYGIGTTVLNMNVSWPGVTVGSYIMAKDIIHARPNNKMFQHEYGHYLQSKRMGWAYLIRVGLPAIMSKGDHDRHPVEVDCNREGVIYFHSKYPDFKNDASLSDTLGWNYYFNPLPDTIGQRVPFKRDSLTVIDLNNPIHVKQLESLKVKATFVDYAFWVFPPAAYLVGVCHAHRYNKEQLAAQGITE